MEFREISGLLPKDYIIMFAKFRDNPLRIDRLDTEKRTFILDHTPPSDRLYVVLLVGKFL